MRLPLSQREAGKTRHRERLNIVTAVGLRLETYIPQGALQARHEAEATYKEHMIRFALPKDLLPRQHVGWLNNSQGNRYDQVRACCLAVVMASTAGIRVGVGR